MHLRCILQAAAAAAARKTLKPSQNPFLIIPTIPKLSPLSPLSSFYSSKTAASKSKSKSKAKSKDKSAKESSTATKDDDAFPGTEDLDAEDADPEDLSNVADPPPPIDKTLDVGPKGLPLFAMTRSIAELGRKDACTYMDFSLADLIAVLAEGLPSGMKREFKETRRSALLVRQNFLDLRDNFRRIVDPPLHNKGVKVRKQIVLDGPVSCGKSIALAMLVHWARSEGWLVLYVPQGKEWTHGGFFYKHPDTGLWDTPIQAAKILQDFLKFNKSQLEQLKCQCYDPIPLGEGAGVGWMRGADSMAMPEGSSLFDLIQTGLTYTHAAVGVVVRLRKELSMVKDVPVLIAIDQYNSWFTFSDYQEPVTPRSCRPIHARELSTVNAYRSMMNDDMMVGAFSHSTAVGKLRKDLPDVPLDARINLPRYSLDEAATVCHYYLRQRVIRPDAFSEEKWKKIYYLSNGNGSEMRWLVPFM
ncbi:28S ribosomal protein S29, mitochondrial isoform X1 [Cinnamomum micranthum f. kanehirae]|uniref:Small ribosomal subunit protein mS29 n=1 Tax=Cinnamomum micranthum f. kanehirae TaxID=337451 RepID=A0A3S3N1E9_9MAGN|nr:28S ribosomal protein S29, mitochondrial isoform X1 [Cinnamomum micranthum f. kanehirae]